MCRLGLSNLQLRSNLLPEDFPGRMKFISAFEVKDILRRNPFLTDELTPEQRKEWRARLFDGDCSVSMAEGDRHRAWLMPLAERVEEVLAGLEGRADLELTFEVLCVAELLATPRFESTYTAKARLWAGRARAILERPEFQLTPQLIDDRLAEILGDTVSVGGGEDSRVY